MHIPVKARRPDLINLIAFASHSAKSLRESQHDCHWRCITGRISRTSMIEMKLDIVERGAKAERYVGMKDVIKTSVWLYLCFAICICLIQE